MGRYKEKNLIKVGDGPWFCFG